MRINYSKRFHERESNEYHNNITNNMKSTIIIYIAAITLTALNASAHNADAPTISLERVKPVSTTPILARDCEEGKTILVDVTIDENGKVVEAKAVKSNRHDVLLAERVVRSVQDWTFGPATDEDNHPVAARFLIPVTITSIQSA